MPIPTLQEFARMFPDEQACITYLVEHEVFYSTLDCPSCSRPMSRNVGKGVFRCSSKICNNRQFSLRKHTFFYGSSMKVLDILRLAHLWLSKVTHTSAVTLTGYSSATVTKFYKHFRQLVSSSLLEEDQIIGGPGVVVEVDETKLGKRKYHRGHRVDGVWVLTGIERTEAGRIFLVPLPNRNAATLAEVINQHVHPGSILYTDCWSGYGPIESTLGIEHHTVNHSRYFKDPITGVCTNTVEGLNNGLKQRISVRNRNRQGIDGFLTEYIWRRLHSSNLWTAFIEAIRDIHYDLE